MKNVLLVKYGEIATRGKNRYLVENKLIRTIIKRLDKYQGYRVYKEQGRILVVNEETEFDYDTVIPIVTKILGVTAVCPGIEFEDQSIESLREHALKHFKEHFPKLLSRHRVNSGGRLVKEKNFRLVYQGTAQCQLLLHSS